MEFFHFLRGFLISVLLGFYSTKNSLVIRSETPLLDDMQIPDTSDNDAVELLIEIEEALNYLTDLQRKAVYELIIKDRKEKEAAAELGISRQAINNAKRQAIKILRKYLIPWLCLFMVK